MTLQPDFASARAGAQRLPIWQQLALAGCVLALLAAGLQAYRARGEARSAASRLAEVAAEVAAARARVAALEARTRSAAAGALAPDEASPARVVLELASLLPDAVRLERLAIDYRRGGELELQVVARDAGAWDRLLQNLEGSAHVREAEPGPEARAAEVRSLVRARFVPGPR